MKSELIYQSSTWFILLCLLAGVAYAVFLYQRKSSFASKPRLILAFLRGLLVSLICFLLFNPLVRSTKSIVEKPTVVVAIDNSSSMNAMGAKQMEALKAGLKKIKADVENSGQSIEFESLNQEGGKDFSIDSLKFNQKQTNLSDLLLTLKNNYEGRNLTDVVLISDGIVNAGISPTYAKYNFNIHTVGVGDTTQKRDIKILAVEANRIAYLGNKFPIQVEVSANGFQGKTTSVLLKQNGQVIDKQAVSFGKNEDLKTVNFIATSNQKGMQRFTVEVAALGGESSVKNNVREVYIDIVDGKEKILLVALSPHPDLKAIRAIIEKNDLYELEIKTLSATADLNEIGSKPFDVLILHQLPDNIGLSGQVLPRLVNAGKPILYILGNQSNLSVFNGLQPVLTINAQSGKVDKVSAKFNPAFKLFNLDANRLNILEKLPPLQVPYGEVRPLTGTETILFQKIGTLPTPKPLLAVNTSGERKTAVLMGEGLWQWRMEEFSLSDKQEVVDDIFLKTLQLISVKDDKRKLRIYPIRPEFEVGEKVVFENEAYNDIYEKIYNQAISLEIIDEKGKSRTYNYTTTQDNTRFEISDLPQGAYHYKGSTNVLNKKEEVTGQFVVKDTDLEQISTTADFNLLRTLSNQNNGKFFTLNTMGSVENNLTAQHSKDKVSAIEEMNELINRKWLFFLILLLASLEWGIRKYLGTY